MAELGIFVHGVLAALHALGVIYNIKRRNWVDSAIHAGAAGYDCWAVTKHIREVEAFSAGLIRAEESR